MSDLSPDSDDSKDKDYVKSTSFNSAKTSPTDGPSLFLLVGMGFNLVADVVGFTLVGIGLDFVLKSYPVLTSIGVFTGIAVASISTWLLMRKYLK